MDMCRLNFSKPYSLFWDSVFQFVPCLVTTHRSNTGDSYSERIIQPWQQLCQSLGNCNFHSPSPFLPAEVVETHTGTSEHAVFLHSPLLLPSSWSQMQSRLDHKVCFWSFLHCFFPVCFCFLSLHLWLDFDHSSIVSLSFLASPPIFLDSFPISNPLFSVSLIHITAVPHFHQLCLASALPRYPLLCQSSPITPADSFFLPAFLFNSPATSVHIVFTVFHLSILTPSETAIALISLPVFDLAQAAKV